MARPTRRALLVLFADEREVKPDYTVVRNQDGSMLLFADARRAARTPKEAAKVNEGSFLFADEREMQPTWIPTKGTLHGTRFYSLLSERYGANLPRCVSP